MHNERIKADPKIHLSIVFQISFILPLKCQISPLVKYRQHQNQIFEIQIDIHI